MKLPMEVNQTQAMTKIVKTGRTAKSGKLPFSGSLETAAKASSSRGAQDSHKKFEVTGTLEGAKPVIETVKGEGITPELEGRVKQALVNAMATPVYPENRSRSANTLRSRCRLRCRCRGQRRSRSC
ncbi:MAG: hypothetical protein IE886_07130 [Campylobacterales bacterium]|nr:hypothetical protein [Campylobacterales bacterium]